MSFGDGLTQGINAGANLINSGTNRVLGERRLALGERSQEFHETNALRQQGFGILGDAEKNLREVVLTKGVEAASRLAATLSGSAFGKVIGEGLGMTPEQIQSRFQTVIDSAATPEEEGAVAGRRKLGGARVLAEAAGVPLRAALGIRTGTGAKPSSTSKLMSKVEAISKLPPGPAKDLAVAGLAKEFDANIELEGGKLVVKGRRGSKVNELTQAKVDLLRKVQAGVPLTEEDKRTMDFLNKTDPLKAAVREAMEGAVGGTKTPEKNKPKVGDSISVQTRDGKTVEGKVVKDNGDGTGVVEVPGGTVTIEMK